MGQLDLATLFCVTVVMAALSGVLMLFTWARDRNCVTLAWWGASHLCGAVGISIVALRGTAPDFVSIGLGNLVLMVVCACEWAGARKFEQRSIRLELIALPMLPWLIGMAVPGFYDLAAVPVRVALFSASATFYVWIAAWEYWRGRGERLVSRWPVIGLLLGHGTWYLGRSVIAVCQPIDGPILILRYDWIVMTTFEGLVYGLSIAFLVLSMAKEREEVLARNAATVDPLTGAPNRRGFAEATAEMSGRSSLEEAPVAFLLFDLDHFKVINDTHGHQVGDEVLRAFADLARRNLRADDLFSRIGGEEFAAILVNASQAAAVATADRIRRNFAERARSLGGFNIKATVSVGVATRAARPETFTTMFDEADAALYLAKASGRNTVRLMADPDSAHDLAPAVSLNRRPPLPHTSAAA